MYSELIYFLQFDVDFWIIFIPSAGSSGAKGYKVFWMKDLLAKVVAPWNLSPSENIMWEGHASTSQRGLLRSTSTRERYRQSFPGQIPLDDMEERPSRPAGGNGLDSRRLTEPESMDIDWVMVKRANRHIRNFLSFLLQLLLFFLWLRIFVLYLLKKLFWI